MTVLPPSSLQYSPEQQRVIDAPGWVAAVAGAGAGKTGLLVGRILQALENGVQPREILAVTFCSGAADELRQRVFRAVRERAAHSAHWANIQQRLPLLGITTIHGLCYRIVTEHPVESGAGFSLTVQDDLESGLYREQQLSRILAELPLDELARVPGQRRAQYLNHLLTQPDQALQATRVTRDDPVAESLGQLFRHVDDAFTVLKRAEGLASFEDLERWAQQALEHAHVRQYYAERLREVIVDEMQDTSEAQWRVLQRIGENARVVTVGDEKQAIYSFRGGNATVFREAQEQTRARGGELVRLADNYRSSPAVVATGNALFAQLLGNPQESFVPMRAVRQDDLQREAAEYHQVVDGTAATRAETLAIVLTERLQGSLGLPVIDRRTGETRPARWHDMALLIRSRTHLAAYTAALQQAGVPYVIQGGRGLFNRPEVREAIDLLAAVTDPGDDRLLVAVLRSTFCRWCEAQLYDLATHRQHGESLWQTLQQSTDLASRRAASRLREWRLLSATRSPVQLLQLVDRDSGFSIVHAAQSDGPLRLANLVRFREVLYRWTGQGKGTVASVAQHFQAIRRLRHTRPDEPEAVDPRSDAIQILTVHQAKGQEWPIVAYADAVPGGHRPVAPLHVDTGRGLVLPNSAAWQEVQASRQSAEREEDDRLLYVACTRARDHLILGASVGNARQTQLTAQRLVAALPHGVMRSTYQAGTVEPGPALPLVREGGQLVIDYRPGPGYALPRQIAVSGVVRYAACPRMFAYYDLAGYLPLAGGWSDDPSKITLARALGDAVHRSLQYGWNERRRQRQLSHLSDVERNEVTELLGRLEGPSFRALQGVAWQREVPFEAQIGGLTVRGVVDAYDPEGGVIVDYKTDQEVDPAQHLLQLSVYAHTLGASGAALAYVRHDRLHWFSEVELHAGYAQFCSLTEQMRAGEFSPTPGMVCITCPYGGLCNASV